MSSMALGRSGASLPASINNGVGLKMMVRLSAITRPMRMGDGVEDVVRFFTSLDIVREWFDGKPEDKVAQAIDAVRSALARYAGPQGIVMSGAAWLLTARR